MLLFMKLIFYCNVEHSGTSRNKNHILVFITWPSELVSDPGLVKPGVFVTEF